MRISAVGPNDGETHGNLTDTFSNFHDYTASNLRLSGRSGESINRWDNTD